VRDSSVREARRREPAVVWQQPSVVRSQQSGRSPAVTATWSRRPSEPWQRHRRLAAVGTIALRECDRRAGGAVRRRRTAEFGRRRSRGRARPDDPDRGEPVVRSPTEAIARRPTARSRGSTCSSSGRCSRPPARGTTGERVANRSRASRVPNHVSDHAATGGARSLSRTRLGGKLQATRQRVVAIALARRAPGAAIPSRKAFVRWARASHLRCGARSRSLDIPSPSADVESRSERLSKHRRRSSGCRAGLAPAQRHAGVPTVPQRRANAVVWTPAATALLLVRTGSEVGVNEGLLAHVRESQVRLRVVADQAGSKHTGDSRNRGKGGQPAWPITTPDRQARGDAHL